MINVPVMDAWLIRDTLAIKGCNFLISKVGYEQLLLGRPIGNKLTDERAVKIKTGPLTLN